MKKIFTIIVSTILLLSASLVSCSSAKHATHEKVTYTSELKSLSTAELNDSELKTELEDLGVPPFTVEKLAEPRDDAADEICVISSVGEKEGAPHLVLTSVHTSNGVLISVDAVWDQLPADRYLDVLGVYFNIGLCFDTSVFTSAWISYGGTKTDMKANTDYRLHMLYERAVAMSYDLGALTKGMEIADGPFIIHFDLYGIAPQSGTPYNLCAYYDHGTNGYDKNIKINNTASNTGWQFDIKDGSAMSASFYEMLSPSLLIYSSK